MQELNLVLVIIGGLVLLLGLISDLIRRRLIVSEPIIAVAVGFVLGSGAGFDFIDLTQLEFSQRFLEEAARITLGIGVMGVALRIPKGFIARHWRPVTFLLSLVMLTMWAISGALAYFLLGLPFWIAMLIGAIVTPTDPILASSIVTEDFAERNLPERVRHMLSAESGANDGLAYLVVFLSILFLTRPLGDAVVHWLTRLCFGKLRLLYQ
jgi:NhaP-type Na+/H+ or K+/H+ antiporter